MKRAVEEFFETFERVKKSIGQEGLEKLKRIANTKGKISKEDLEWAVESFKNNLNVCEEEK